MSRVILHRKVTDDLNNILKYLNEQRSGLGNRFADAAMETMERLAELPGMGSPKRFRLRHLQGARSWAVAGFRSYLIIYKAVEGGILVFGVLHGARRLGSVLRDRT